MSTLKWSDILKMWETDPTLEFEMCRGEDKSTLNINEKGIVKFKHYMPGGFIELYNDTFTLIRKPVIFAEAYKAYNKGTYENPICVVSCVSNKKYSISRLGIVTLYNAKDEEIDGLWTILD